MTDENGDGIYSCTLPMKAGTILKYFFAYQNGPDPERDIVEESLPGPCGNDDGYRGLKVPHRNLTLNAVAFSSCTETMVMVTNITITGAEGISTAKAGEIFRMKASVIPANASDASVTWSVDDESVAEIDPETGQLTIARSGKLKITATADDGSGVNGTRDVEITVEPTSDFSPEESDKIRYIYPNPASGKVYIHNPLSGKLRYKIYSASGHHMAGGFNFPGTRTEVTISHFPKGIYIVKITGDNFTKTEKLIVE